MDIIITENQELKAKKKIAFFLLDKQKYNLVEIDNDRIYFVKNIGDKKAEIRYDKSGGWCRISYDFLIKFFSTITGFQEFEVQELTSNWVEHTLQIGVEYNTIYSGQFWVRFP